MTLNVDPSAWEKVKFGDVVRQVKASTDPVADGVKRYVAGEHMDSENLEITRWGMVGDGYLGPAFHRRFKSGQILYGSRRTYLRKVALADFDGVCANTTFVMESADPSRLLPELLPFVMSTEDFHAHSIAESKGSVNPYVNWPDIAKYEFRLPPLDQQRQIADLLWDLERHRRAIASLGTQVRRIDLSSLGVLQAVPKVRLGSLLARIETGKSLPGTEYLSLEDAPSVLKVSAVGPEGFRPEERKELLNHDGFLSLSSVRAGDLLLTRSNTAEYVGRTCVVPFNLPHVMLSDKILRLVPRPDGPSAAYLHWALSLPGSRKQIRTMASGTGAAMKNISQDKLRRLEIPLGSVEQQRRVLDLVEMTDVTASQVDMESRSLDGLRRQILWQLGRSA